MHRAYVLLGIWALAFSCKASKTAEQVQAEADVRISAFQDQMLKSLTKSLLDHGPVGSIQTCSQVSPELEAEYSQAGWVLRRTSKKVRNPAHRPTPQELEVLDTWERDPNSVKTTTVLIQGGFLVMKPIKLGNPTCLQCHGSPQEIPAALLAEIQRLYPEDQATGYKLGDLRGAFSAMYKE